MIKILKTSSIDFKKKFNNFLNLRRNYPASKLNRVKKIIEDIRRNGDKSLIKYEKKFNKIKNLNSRVLFFSEGEIKKHIQKLDPKIKSSINIAFGRIFKFHRHQSFKNFKLSDKYRNTFAYRSKPMEKIGI